MATYSSDALDVVLAEVRRTRDLQSSRLSNLRSTAGILVGASGVAAGLLGAAAANPLWLIPIACYLVAAVLGLAVIWPTSAQHVQPTRTFQQSESKGATQVKVNVVAGIVAEYNTQEERVELRAGFITWGAVFFVLGIASIVVLAIIQGVAPGSDQPIRIIIEQPIEIEE